jgi:hypothetical protein
VLTTFLGITGVGLWHFADKPLAWRAARTPLGDRSLGDSNAEHEDDRNRDACGSQHKLNSLLTLDPRNFTAKLFTHLGLVLTLVGQKEERWQGQHYQRVGKAVRNQYVC